jgi:hypothetical protein
LQGARKQLARSDLAKELMPLPREPMLPPPLAKKRRLLLARKKRRRLIGKKKSRLVGIRGGSPACFCWKLYMLTSETTKQRIC